MAYDDGRRTGTIACLGRGSALQFYLPEEVVRSSSQELNLTWDAEDDKLLATPREYGGKSLALTFWLVAGVDENIGNGTKLLEAIAEIESWCLPIARDSSSTVNRMVANLVRVEAGSSSFSGVLESVEVTLKGPYDSNNNAMFASITVSIKKAKIL